MAAAKLTRVTHKIAIQLHLVAESCTICSSRSRRPVPKLLDTPSYVNGIKLAQDRDQWRVLVNVVEILVGCYVLESSDVNESPFNAFSLTCNS
jgi:hypothetical protein